MVLNFDNYICRGFSSDILILENGYGRIVLYVSEKKVEKPSDKELKVLKNADTSYCQPLTRKMEKELSMDMKVLYTTEFQPRTYYTIYLFTYRNINVYILEYYDGASAEYKYYVYSSLIDAISAIYPSSVWENNYFVVNLTLTFSITYDQTMDYFSQDFIIIPIEFFVVKWEILSIVPH